MSTYEDIEAAKKRVEDVLTKVYIERPCWLCAFHTKSYFERCEDCYSSLDEYHPIFKLFD